MLCQDLGHRAILVEPSIAFVCIAVSFSAIALNFACLWPASSPCGLLLVPLLLVLVPLACGLLLEPHIGLCQDQSRPVLLPPLSTVHCFQHKGQLHTKHCCSIQLKISTLRTSNTKYKNTKPNQHMTHRISAVLHRWVLNGHCSSDPWNHLEEVIALCV